MPVRRYRARRSAAPPGTFARMKLVDAVSLRSRRRKLRLFLDEVRPTPASTILDVGVDEIGFGAAGGHSGCGTHNFFEELYPWRDRITALGLHDGAGFRERYPEVAYVQGDACASRSPTGVRHRLLERGDRARGRRRAAAALRRPRPCASAGRVFLTTPNRWFPVEVHTRSRGPLASAGVAARAYDLSGRWARANHLLGPWRPARLFPGDVRIVNLGLTLVALA